MMRASRPFAFAVASCAVAFAAFALVIWVRPFGADGTQLASNLLSTAAPLFAAAGAALAARRMSGRARLAWGLVAAGMLSWALGQMVWTYDEQVLGDNVPFPSWPDVGYLGLIPLALVGLSLFPTKESSASARLRVILDGLIVAASLFFVAWTGILSLLVEQANGVELVVGLAYPAGDVLLTTWVIILGMHMERGSRRVWWLLGGGVLCFAFSDSAFVYTTALDIYATGGVIDLGWFAGFLMIALAGLAAAERPVGSPSITGRPSGVSIFVPYLPFSAAVIGMIGQVAKGGEVGFVPFFTLVVLSHFVMARQLLTMIETTALAQRLQVTNERLTEAETVRARLLNTITHDLQNPLMPIKMQLDRLQRPTQTLTDDQRRSLGILRRNVDHLQHLVRDVKDLARLDGGKLPLRAERIDVTQVVRAAIETYAPVAAEHGVALRAERTDGFIAIADKERVTQVLFNLLSNAMKFTPEGGEVAVGLCADEEGGRLYVRDSGRGLTSEEMAKLFKPFSQVHAPHEVKERGSGLGLYLSRAIAEQHGGALWVESEGRGRGSTFHLRLPPPPAQAAAATPLVSPQA